VCNEEDLSYLRNLPIRREVTADSTQFYLIHAMPTDPLFGYCPEESELWLNQVDWINADMLVVGHTHTPFLKRVGLTTILNPGSLGQPKTSRPLACYAVWEDGKIARKEYEYPLADTIHGIREMPISSESKNALIAVLESGGTRFSNS
jgi:predicted phosphodiesterase